MPATNHIPASNIAPVNFATIKPGGLPALIARLNAAVAEVEKWAPIEEQLGDQFRKSAERPKVKGGVIPASTLIRDGKPDLEIPASDWFFRTREDIEKSHGKALEGAEDRTAVNERYAALLADWDAQEATYNAAKPRGLVHAKRMLNRAHRAWSVAEHAIVNYRPQSLADVAEWLAYSGRDEMRGVFFTPSEGDLKHMMRTAAAVLAEHGVN